MENASWWQWPPFSVLCLGVVAVWVWVVMTSSAQWWWSGNMLTGLVWNLFWLLLWWTGLQLLSVIFQTCMSCLAIPWPTQCPFKKRLLFKLSCVTHWLQVTWTPEYLSPFFAACVLSCLLDNSTCMSHRQTHLFPLKLPFFHILSLVNSTCDLFSWNPERKTS